MGLLIVAVCGALLALGALPGCGRGAMWLPGSALGEWSQQGGTPDGRAWQAAGPRPPLAPRWQWAGRRAPVGAALVAGGVFLQATTGAELVAVDLETGRRLGVRRFGSPLLGSPVTWGDLIVVARSEPAAGLEAVNRRTGAVVWRQAGVFDAPLARADSLVLAARADGQLLALEARTGAPRWSAPVGGRLWTGAATSGGVAFVGNSLGELVAVTLDSGQVRWRAQLPGGAVRTRPAIVQDAVYAGTASGDLVAVEAVSGKRRWSARVGALPAPGLACGGGAVVVGAADRQLHAVEQDDGRGRWAYPTDGVIVGAPAIVSDVVYCGSTDGYLYAVELGSGRLVERYRLDAPVASPVTLTGDLVLVVSERGSVYAMAAR
jgi:outer membrane protein assembly factor BamB